MRSSPWRTLPLGVLRTTTSGSTSPARTRNGLKKELKKLGASRVAELRVQRTWQKDATAAPTLHKDEAETSIMDMLFPIEIVKRPERTVGVMSHYRCLRLVLVQCRRSCRVPIMAHDTDGPLGSFDDLDWEKHIRPFAEMLILSLRKVHNLPTSLSDRLAARFAARSVLARTSTSLALSAASARL
jgi:hypothetical protein